MTDSRQKAMNLSRTEREVYHCGQFNELLEAMKDYNEKIYENHQEGMKDVCSHEETMFDIRRYGVENSMIAELRIPKMDCDCHCILARHEIICHTEPIFCIFKILTLETRCILTTYGHP